MEFDKCYTNQCKLLPLNHTVEKQRKKIWLGQNKGHEIETVKTGNRIRAAEGKRRDIKLKECVGTINLKSLDKPKEGG
jgi:hypothetical protein